jgi:hypothetical protein
LEGEEPKTEVNYFFSENVNLKKMLTKILTKLYWPIVGIYILLIVMFIFLYFTQINDWSDRSYYNRMNVKRIGIPLLFLLSSLYMNYQGNQKVANILLYIPVGFSLLILIGGLLIVLMYSKSK